MDVSLRKYDQAFSRENFPDLRGRRFSNALFSECKIGKIRDALFHKCVMAGSEITGEDIRDILGVTATLDCQTFENLKLSAVTLDAFLFLLTLTSGNDVTRSKIEAAIEPQRLRLFRKIFPTTE